MYLKNVTGYQTLTAQLLRDRGEEEGIKRIACFLSFSIELFSYENVGICCCNMAFFI